MITQRGSSRFISKKHVQLQVIGNLVIVPPSPKRVQLLAEQRAQVQTAVAVGLIAQQCLEDPGSFFLLCPCVLAFDFMLNGHKDHHWYFQSLSPNSRQLEETGKGAVPVLCPFYQSSLYIDQMCDYEHITQPPRPVHFLACKMELRRPVLKSKCYGK